MYKISTLNKISPKGMELLPEEYEVVDDVESANAILVRSASMHDMELSDNLLAIARAGAGVNNIPVDKCSENGIVVFNTPGANANAVKELVIASILMSSRNIPAALEWTKTLSKDAANAVEKNKSLFAGEEIKGKTLGVVGLGFIGVMLANASESLGMKVVGYDPYLSLKAAHDLSPSVKIFESLETMLPHCDYVSIHVPATPATKGLINYKQIDAMKNKGVLLNFSRDELVVSEDVIRAIEEKKLRLYITDFPVDDIIGKPGVILIPHLGASTAESEENCAIMAAREVIDYLKDGNIANSVNFPTINAGVKPEGIRLCVLNKNIPSILGQITGVFADRHINIDNLINKSKGDYAVTIIDISDTVDQTAIVEALTFDGIISVRVV